MSFGRLSSPAFTRLSPNARELLIRLVYLMPMHTDALSGEALTFDDVIHALWTPLKA